MSGKYVRCVSCVAAVSSNMGIGKNGKLPWPALRTDLEFLEKITTEVNEQAFEFDPHTSTVNGMLY